MASLFGQFLQQRGQNLGNFNDFASSQKSQSNQGNSYVPNKNASDSVINNKATSGSSFMDIVNSMKAGGKGSSLSQIFKQPEPQQSYTNAPVQSTPTYQTAKKSFDYDTSSGTLSDQEGNVYQENAGKTSVKAAKEKQLNKERALLNRTNESGGEEDRGVQLSAGFETSTDNPMANAKEDKKDAQPTLSDADIEGLTLSGQQLASDDLAGIAAAQYLNNNLSDKYGDSWGRFQLEGTYDEWKDALADETLLPYLTDITGDQRFFVDDAFNFDNYWDYTRGLNPQDYANMSYDDWKLLNGTSAGAMNSFNTALADSGYMYYVDPDFLSDAYGADEEGKLNFDDNGNPINAYGKPLGLGLAENGMGYIDADRDELIAMLNSAAMSYGARNGRSQSDWTDEELAFLNGIRPAAVSSDKHQIIAPMAIDYSLFADPNFDHFQGTNPYLAIYDYIYGSNVKSPENGRLMQAQGNKRHREADKREASQK